MGPSQTARMSCCVCSLVSQHRFQVACVLSVACGAAPEPEMAVDDPKRQVHTHDSTNPFGFVLRLNTSLWLSKPSAPPVHKDVVHVLWGTSGHKAATPIGVTTTPVTTVSSDHMEVDSLQEDFVFAHPCKTRGYIQE